MSAHVKVRLRKQDRAVELLAEGSRTHVQIATELGIAPRTLVYWLDDPAFQARVDTDLLERDPSWLAWYLTFMEAEAAARPVLEARARREAAEAEKRRQRDLKRALWVPPAGEPQPAA